MLNYQRVTHIPSIAQLNPQVPKLFSQSRPVRMLGNLVSASRDMGYLTPASWRTMR